ncbi:hypothetical protein EDD16DRAFT_197283 [Pisolithus croceorrhizus]|nr:hypothetical protein EDD16DRAFT_197283 [Pisolithus croceorrhizus]KAI6160541.1 hypothetical protein EDD17DRAFT_792619 [Pisolithus thermaeus]
MAFSPKSEIMGFTMLLVAASFAYSSAAMPAMSQVAVASNSFNSVGAAIDNSDGIVPDTTVDGFQMSSPKIEAYSPSPPSVLPAKSTVYQFTFTSDFPSASPQASESSRKLPDNVSYVLTYSCSCGVSNCACDQLSACAFKCDTEADLCHPQCNGQRCRLGACLDERHRENIPRAFSWYFGFGICVRHSSGFVRFAMGWN